MRYASVLALGLAFGASAHGATAADLGGNCCADLEERIAELEATTARKGNRKVSLEVSGHINEALMIWDDGTDSDAYVVTNDSGRSRVRFKGKAKVTNDVEAGYYLEFGIRNARSDRVDQDNDEGVDNGIDIRQSNWYLKSKTLGEVRVGFGNGASESITELNVTQTKDIAKNSDTEDFAAGFQLRNSETGALSGLEWRRLVKDDFIQPGEGSRGNYVMYTSPEFAGFAVSAAWGEDDFWDVALRYAGEFAGFKLAAGVAYGENTDDLSATMPCLTTDANGQAECHQFGGSFSALHEQTGLFVTVGAGIFVDENIKDDSDFTDVSGVDDESTFYSVQAGIEKKWFSLGKTTLYGEYFRHEGGANDREADAALVGAGNADFFIQSSEVDMFGLGVIQGIEAAAMSVYLTYRHFEADATFAQDGTDDRINAPIDDLDVVMGGALIKF